MRKSKKIKQLEKANAQLIKTIENMKIKDFYLQERICCSLEDYCEGCPNIEITAKPFYWCQNGVRIDWGVYISCEHAEKCKQLVKHFEEDK